MKQILLLAVLALAACGRERVVPEFNSNKPGENIAVPPISLRIRTPQELQRIYVGAGMAIPEGHELKAFIARDPEGTVAIYSPSPIYVDDFREALDEADQIERAARDNADRMARFLNVEGALERVSHSQLSRLKRKLRLFDMTTGKWRLPR